MQEAPKTASRLMVFLDIAERAVLTVLFSFFAWSLLHSFIDDGNLISLMLLVSEGLVVVFLLIRRSTIDISIRPRDWLLAFCGTGLPLLAQPAQAGSLLPPLACGLIMLAGITLQVSAKLILRRSFGIVAANRGVKVGGPYRFVRHPMYAGYVLAQIGFLLANPTLWNAIIYGLATVFQIGRILAEEAVLSRDQAYRDFRTAVPYRLLPGIF